MMKKYIFLALIAGSHFFSLAYAQEVIDGVFCDSRTETIFDQNTLFADINKYSYTIELQTKLPHRKLDFGGLAQYTYRHGSNISGELPCGTDKAAVFYSNGEYFFNPQTKKINLQFRNSPNSRTPSNSDILMEGTYESDSSGKIESITVTVVNPDMLQWFSTPTTYKRVE